MHCLKLLYNCIILRLLPDIGLGVRVFANGPGDLGSIPGRVIPKTQKMVLDASLLSTQHYKVRIKGKVEQSRKGVAPSPTHWCSSYRKGSLRVTLDYGRQLLYFEVIENRDKSECFKLVQRYVIKSLVAEKCKLCEIYERMYDVYGEVCFSKNIFTYGLNMGLQRWVWLGKTIHRVETYSLSGKEKVPGVAVSEEEHTESLMG